MLVTRATSAQTDICRRAYLSSAAVDVDVPPRAKVIDYLTNIGAVYAPEWAPSAELTDPKDENLIDVEGSYLSRPTQFEPGQGPNPADPNASAPDMMFA